MRRHEETTHYGHNKHLNWVSLLLPCIVLPNILFLDMIIYSFTSLKRSPIHPGRKLFFPIFRVKGMTTLTGLSIDNCVISTALHYRIVRNHQTHFKFKFSLPSPLNHYPGHLPLQFRLQLGYGKQQWRRKLLSFLFPPYLLSWWDKPWVKWGILLQ